MNCKHISMCIIWLYLLLKCSVAGPHTISCSDEISSVSGGSDDAITTVACPANTITVSCGVKTFSPTATNLDGNYYDETNDQCVAQNGIGSAEGVYATARCCTFDIDISCNNVAGNYVYGTSTTSCNSGQQLTGCGAKSPWSKVGAYPGDAASSRPDLISDFNINYETTNVCNANSGGGKLRADAICCTSSSEHDYTLQCITRYGEGSTSSQTSCPTDYAMIGCSGYGLSGNTNAWYIENNKCYARSSNTDNTWAVARCCMVDRPYNGYKAGPALSTYSEAETYCNSMGETLAIIRDEVENDAVSKLCDNVDGDKTNGCWIGLYKNNDEYEWQDGSNYLLQYINMPIFTQFNDECIAVPPEESMNLKWKSYPCSDKKYPICDYYTLAPTPSPTSCNYEDFCIPTCLAGDEEIASCDCNSWNICQKKRCRRLVCSTANIEPYLEPHSEPKHIHYFNNTNFYIIIIGLLIIFNFICCGLWILRKQCGYKKAKIVSYQYDEETDTN